MTSIARYDYAFDPHGPDWPARLLRQVPQTGAVLELGPGTGAMTQVLLARGQAVTVVENDPESVALLKDMDCEVLQADLDSADWPKLLAGRQFDAILACDVLEHLKHPERVLQALRGLAAPAASLVISMPNIAYAGVVAGLSQGLFEYADKGILDRTHLKFFTRRSFERLLHEQGWAPQHWEGHELPVERSEFIWQWQALPAAQRQFLAAAPYADVYQWMAVSVPAKDVLVAQIRSARADTKAVREQLQALTLRHKAEHASLLEHQKAFAGAKEAIRKLEQDILSLTEQLSQAQQHLQEGGRREQQAAERIDTQIAQITMLEKSRTELVQELDYLRNHGFVERAARAVVRRLRRWRAP